MNDGYNNFLRGMGSMLLAILLLGIPALFAISLAFNWGLLISTVIGTFLFFDFVLFSVIVYSDKDHPIEASRSGI
jgi:hypothetical protein